MLSGTKVQKLVKLEKKYAINIHRWIYLFQDDLLFTATVPHHKTSRHRY